MWFHCVVCIHCLDNISLYLGDTDVHWDPLANPQSHVFEWESPETVRMDHVPMSLSPSPEHGECAKPCLEPQQEGVWVGFLLDLLKGMFYVPQEKVLKLNRCCAAV